jgi:hypothetical protein
VVYAGSLFFLSLPQMNAVNLWGYSFEISPGSPDSSGWDHAIVGVKPPAIVVEVLRENRKSVMEVV